jgi:arylformamidase
LPYNVNPLTGEVVADPRLLDHRPLAVKIISSNRHDPFGYSWRWTIIRPATAVPRRRPAMRIYDITLGISPALPVWPGNPGVELERTDKIEAGANANVSRLALGVHTGTHVDAPVHFIQGAAGVESLPLDVLIGRAFVLHLRRAAQITADALARAKMPARTRRLLIRTRNSDFWSKAAGEFHTDFAGVTADGAEWLVERRIELIGVDYLSVAPWKQSRPTHEVLLKAGVVVVEGLNLGGIKAGAYDLICLPLKLVGSDGAPARAVLVER